MKVIMIFLWVIAIIAPGGMLLVPFLVAQKLKFPSANGKMDLI